MCEISGSDLFRLVNEMEIVASCFHAGLDYSLLSQISDPNPAALLVGFRVRRSHGEANPRILIKSCDRFASDVFQIFPALLVPAEKAACLRDKLFMRV